MHCCAWFHFYAIAIMRVPCASFFSLPKPLFWQKCRKTYLAHLLQRVFWLALLSIDGMSARGRENGETDRQTGGGWGWGRMGKAYALTQGGGGEGIPWWARWFLHLVELEGCLELCSTTWPGLQQGAPHCVQNGEIWYNLQHTCSLTQKNNMFSFIFSIAWLHLSSRLKC